MLIPPFALTLCMGAPTITSITKTTDTLGACFSVFWYLKWTVVISGTLQAGQEYYWELATDSAGTSWGFWKRGTAAFQEGGSQHIGSDGLGEPLDRYHRVRVYVVPVGESPPNECNGPTTSAQASRLNVNGCAA